VELQAARKDFEAHGLGLAAITYDNPETLGDFAERKGIEYPLLADPTSETLRRFGMFDPDASAANIPGGAAPGVAYPGYLWIDRAGVVRERYLDGSYDDRRTAGSVIGALFPALLSKESRTLAAPHATLALAQSDREIVPGNRLTLALDLVLPEGMHVYAREARGYRPIELALEPSPTWTLSPVQYPAAETLKVAQLDEEIPVHTGRVALRVEAALVVDPALLRTLETSPGQRTTLHLKGVLRYQACDATQCFPPCEVPVAWDIAVRPLDFERTDPFLRKPPK